MIPLTRSLSVLCLAAALGLAASPAGANSFQFDLTGATITPSGNCPPTNGSCDILEATIPLGGGVVVAASSSEDIWITFWDVAQGLPQHLEVFDAEGGGTGPWELFTVRIRATGSDGSTIESQGHLSMVMGDPSFSVGGDGNSETFVGGGSCVLPFGETDLECPGFSSSTDTTSTSFLFHDLHLTVSDPRAPTGAPTALTLTELELVVFAEGGFELGVWVPEPSVATLLLGGLALLGVTRVRR